MLSKILVKESLREGWAAFKVRPWPIVITIGALIAMFASAQFGSEAIFGERSWQSNLLGVVIQFLIMIICPGIQAYLLKAVRKQEPDWPDLLWGWKYPLRIFLADILSILPALAVILTLGVALLFLNSKPVPDSIIFIKYITLGVLGLAVLWLIAYFSIGLNQWSLILIDKNVSALQSVKLSWKVMLGQKLTFSVLFLILVLVNCLGALTLLIGILVSIPFSIATFTAFYVKISEKPILES